MKRTLFFLLFTGLTVPCVAQWNDIGQHSQITAFGVHDSSLFIATTQPNIYRYTVAHGYEHADNGIDFTQGNVTSFASLGRYFLAGMTRGGGTAASSYRSSNDGANWAGSLSGNVCVADRYVFSAVAGFGTGTGIYRSTDSGAYDPWQLVSDFPGIGIASMGTCVFAWNANSLWYSPDTGNHWSQLSPPFVGSITPMGSLLFITGGGKVSESTDSGSQWNSVSVDSGGTVPETVNVLATDGKNLFAGTNEGVFFSTDTGRHWSHVSNAGIVAGDSIVTTMCVYDTLLAINVHGYGQSFGNYIVYTHSIREILDTPKSAVQQPVSLRDTISIYPNPATGLVTIFAGGTAIERVSVLSVLGVEVLTLDKPGGMSHNSEITLDLSKLPSGTYFLRIQAATGTVLRKVVRE